MHQHAHPHGTRGIAPAFWLNVGITVTEFAVGLAIGSLALVADAFHNLSDVVALGMAYAGVRISRRKPDLMHSFGFGRAEVLVGLGNAVTLVLMAGYVVYEAVVRLFHPQTVSGLAVLVVGLLSVLVNVVSVLLLIRGEERESLNIRSAILHLALDALTSVGVVIGAVVLLTVGWPGADPVVGLLLGVVIVLGSIGLIREGIHILMEGVPRGVDLEALAEAILGVKGVCGVHDLHVWNLSSTYRALSAHVVLDESCAEAFQAILGAIRQKMEQTFGIRHCTLEPELVPCENEGLLCPMGHGHGSDHPEPP